MNIHYNNEFISGLVESDSIDCSGFTGACTTTGSAFYQFPYVGTTSTANSFCNKQIG